MADITLRQNNLYRGGKILEFLDNEKILIREKLKTEPHKIDKYHLITEFDRLDLIAYSYYKDIVEDSSKYWWILADVNNIENPLDISEYIGKRILVPDILRILLLS